jgi:hypothetical protein
MDFLKFVGVVVVSILVIAGLTVGATELGYRLDSHYQPLQEQVRANTFSQSQTFNEGMIRDLQNLRQQYMQTGETDDQKTAIRDTVRQRYAAYDPAKLPADLALFYNQMNAQ